MMLKEMFQKDIERDIRGVIKVAQTDEDNIYQELDEYVVTRELRRHLAKFYDNYQKSIDGVTDKMGVWISGFFGSGKSHFLKILAYLLENKKVKGKRAVEFFEDKVEDPLILANMARTAAVDTEVILFNIDSKSSLDNKSKEDAILRVFMKVFYEHRGYYGDIPGVAEMEKYLDNQGVYEAFQTEFKALAGEDWVDRRNTFYFDADYVIGALTKVTNMSDASARNWFEHGVNHFEISIEKFAKDVKAYIDQKGDNFHLIFLVDEIGQYIGDSRNLMLNLQTVAEDLGTHCQGKVWIMVTSQESIDSIVKVKGDDFSRIQGRFDTRLSLSSISVDEVIKKRILLKKDFVNDRLKLLYPEKSAILKNLISFKNSTADLRGFDDEQEFADVYPFIPYQFKLLQHVFEQVRKHGSSGKHLSEGERSMLSAFKEAGLKYKDAEEGVLIPFYAFYDTIKEFLHPTISRVIDGAYQNKVLADDEFNIDLLKVLFMVKYVKELPATIDNIATLMVTHMDEDKLVLKENIKHSLRKLISQTLIQKNGDQYIFLTDDEQDINKEIKALNIDEDLVKRELATYIYQDIFDDRRFRYSDAYYFSFNRKMDEKNYGNQSENIGMHIVSPLSDHYQKSEQELMMMTSGTGEMVIQLGGNDLYVDEMEETLRIEEYRRKKNVTQLPEGIQNILNNKQAEARERRRRVRDQLEDAIKAAVFYINGDKVAIKGSTVKEKLTNGLKLLVENVYTKLGYVKVHIENERDLLAVLSADANQISFDEALETDPNTLAKREIADFISMQDDLKKQVRVKILYDRFEDKPYGWKQLDIAALIGQLLQDQRIRIRYHAEYLEPMEDTNTLLTVLTKAAETDRAIVLKRVKVDERLIRIAKGICRDVFNKTDLADDEDGLVRDIREQIDKQISEINHYKNRFEGRKYPGMSLLNKGLEYFEQFHHGLDNVSFFVKLQELEDQLLDWEEDIVYVKSFFDTEQKKIFDDGIAGLVTYEENQAYLDSDEVKQITSRLEAIIKDPIPYRKIKDIPQLLHALQLEMDTILINRKDNAREKLTTDRDYLTLLAKQPGVKDETRQRITTYYENLFSNMDQFTDMYKVDATISQSTSFKEQMEKNVHQQMADWKKQHDEKRNTSDGTTVVDPIQPVAPVVKSEAIKISQLVAIKTLTTEAEVDLYVQTLSSKLKEMIKSNKQIELID